MQEPQTILITGASSGLGRALALAYAMPGRRLFLCARSREALYETTELCRAFGAEAESQVVDVEDADTVERFVLGCNRLAPLDLVIANAGISGGTGGGEESDEQARAIFATNLGGMLNTVLPAVACMKLRGRGQIALMSSLASTRGFPGAPAYSASKAAVRIYGEALHGALHGSGIRVSVICPGFVRTPMTDVNEFPMPFLMDADRAARIIRRGLARDRALIAFPWPMRTASYLLGLLPAGLAARLLRGLPEKGARAKGSTGPVIDV